MALMEGSLQAAAASIAIATTLMAVESSTVGAAVSGPFHYGWGETRVSCITANGEEYAARDELDVGPQPRHRLRNTDVMRIHESGKSR